MSKKLITCFFLISKIFSFFFREKHSKILPVTVSKLPYFSENWLKITVSFFSDIPKIAMILFLTLTNYQCFRKIYNFSKKKIFSQFSISRFTMNKFYFFFNVCFPKKNFLFQNPHIFQRNCSKLVIWIFSIQQKKIFLVFFIIKKKYIPNFRQLLFQNYLIFHSFFRELVKNYW